MSQSSIFSTYRSGENRVTSSMLAVFQRVGIDLAEIILADAIGEASLDLVTFASQPSAGSPGVPDAELKSSFRYLIETKVVPNSYSSSGRDGQLVRHLDRLDGSYADERLLVITPDAEEPPGIAAMEDDRVVWTSFAHIAQATEKLIQDSGEPASEQQRFLLREMVTFLDAEGLVGVNDTVVVAGRWAYPTYFKTRAYICQANRSIRPVTYLAFYKDKQIKPEIPKVLRRYSELDMSNEGAQALVASGDPFGLRAAEVIRIRLTEGSPDPVNDVYLLSAPDDPDTVGLRGPIRHEGRGAWVQGQRYASIQKLQEAETTADL